MTDPGWPKAEVIEKDGLKLVLAYPVGVPDVIATPPIHSKPMPPGWHKP